MQIGIAQFRDGAMAEEWKSYINPEDYFDSINTSVHGIDDTTVKDAPILAEVADRMYTSLGGHVALCHAHFDRVALAQAFEKYGVRPPSCTWLDSARVARRTWAGFAWRGYGLANVCFALGYRFTHHDALEDAKPQHGCCLLLLKRQSSRYTSGCVGSNFPLIHRALQVA